MEKLNEFLQALVSTSSYELHLEPNVNPYIVSANGRTDVSDEPLQGTQISMIVFPLIPPDVKQDLPNQPQIEFVHPHNLGKFSFVVQKSPNGFNVTVKPVFHDASTISLGNEASEPDREYASEPNEPETGFAEQPADESPVFELGNTIPGFETASAPSSEMSHLANLEPAQEYKPHAPKDESGMQFEASGGSDFLPVFDDTPAFESAKPESHPIDLEPAFEPTSLAASSPFVELPSADRRSGERRKGNLMMTARVDALLQKMLETGASDLYVSVGMPPLVRKSGQLQPIESTEAVITADTSKELFSSIMPAGVHEHFDARGDANFVYEMESSRFRCSVFTDRKGIGGFFRLLPAKVATSDDLRFSKEMIDLCSLSEGLVLIAGPAASGKSTTLCAMIDTINKGRSGRIVTIEETIDFAHENQKSVVNQREVYNHTGSAAHALRAAIREDADVICIDEMTDSESISLAFEAMEKGRLVLATLRSSSAVSAIERVIDDLSTAARHQRASETVSRCVKAVIFTSSTVSVEGEFAAAHEVLMIDASVRDLIRNGNVSQLAPTMQVA